MKNNLLHITNGDFTTSKLESLNIPGKIFTWREMLCEGKTTTDVGTEDFWKSRFDFLSSTYKVTKQRFIDLTLKEFRSLCQQKTQDEIVLWFEYDLFCQINMLAILSWIKKHRKEAKISLICSGKESNYNELKGLSELKDEELKEFFLKRKELSKDDIEYADYIWQLYCSDSPLKLQNLPPSSTFQYLDKALDAHLKRFPTIKNGLNEIENTILDTVFTKNPNNEKALINFLLSNQNLYGFGDIQYKVKIEELKKLFKSYVPFQLNDLGIDVYQKKQNFYPSIRNDYSYLGGSLKYNYLYNEIDGKILKL
ncbi:DUF1835 domain-containing protein [Pseudofulvibacter geojedonensis]|uniref:DUF1835 domain-containing protein n=1 Tax=Pseudofulvibacter geojedonensis TaxID=1123758 RepID=A0ABW3HY42_9FLAO